MGLRGAYGAQLSTAGGAGVTARVKALVSREVDSPARDA